MSTVRLEYDVIVVGAGMAGSTAAAVAAREGLNVVVLERGQRPGSKNYFGGALYTHSLVDVYPDYFDRGPPLERPVTETGFWLLSNDGVVKATASGGLIDSDPADAYIALRAKFDHWWAKQAEAEGAFVIPKTLVTDFLRNGSCPKSMWTTC